jgi:hypothetical protein
MAIENMVATRHKDVLRTLVSDRDPDVLATAYGFETIFDFMNDIPRGGEVIDLGAGLSRLGHEVATNRPDVKWIDLDARYQEPNTLNRVMHDAPDNLVFAGHNIFDIEELHGIASFDRVYSYFLFPYLRRQGAEQYRKTCEDVLKLVREGGKLAIGPLKRGGINLAPGQTTEHELPIGRTFYSAHDSSVTVDPSETNMSHKDIATELDRILW